MPKPVPDPSVDDSNPDLDLPVDAPVWAKLIEQSNRHASKDRRENTIAIREMAAELRTHHTGAATRHVELVGKLEAIKTAVAAVDDAVDNAAREKSALRRSVESGVRELWSAFKVPLAGLVTAGATYYAWAHFQIPTTPTPVAVTVGSPASPVVAMEPAAVGIEGGTE